MLWADSIEGVRWLSSHPTLRGVALVTATCGMAIEMAQGTLVLFALRELRLPISSFGLFASSLAVGSLVGTLLAPRLVARFGRTATMTGALAILPLFLAAVGLSPGVFTAAAALACFAGAVGLWNVLSISLRQALTPNAMYGRVHGAWRALVWGSLPIGAATGGLIADHLGLRAPWLLAAAVFVVTAGCAVVVLHRARDEINQLRRPAPVAVG